MRGRCRGFDRGTSELELHDLLRSEAEREASAGTGVLGCRLLSPRAECESKLMNVWRRRTLYLHGDFWGLHDGCLQDKENLLDFAFSKLETPFSIDRAREPLHNPFHLRTPNLTTDQDCAQPCRITLNPTPFNDNLLSP